ncbi:MAG TPA: fluoride efflux transporter CrcB [Beijerinckiaceae bacterium]|jgi:CrcB protein|nr:crcB [Microvirga sp.]HZB37636.1 fluoride efflux transporter CrcB [Beijerinckiaceae bacterium]
MQGYLLVFVGAGIGGALRHGVNLASERAFGPGFPWSTLAVNVVGSFAMGMLAGWLAVKAGAEWSQPVRLFLATGILGGFTTFSAFSLDAVLLWERGAKYAALAYIGGSVALSIGGLLLGLFLARHLA